MSTLFDRGSTPNGTAIFDVDGTTVDTLGLARIAQYCTITNILRRHHIKPPTFEAYNAAIAPFFGQGPFVELMTGLMVFAPKLAGHYKPAQLVEMLHEVEAELAHAFIEPFDGLMELFGTIGKLNLAMVHFTSGVEHFVHQSYGVVLPHEFGLKDLHRRTDLTGREKTALLGDVVRYQFGIPAFTLVGRESVKRAKPYPYGVRVGLRRVNGHPSRAAIVGDDKGDMLSGFRGKVPNRIGLCHGESPLRTEEELIQAGATEIAYSLEEVGKLLASFFN